MSASPMILNVGDFAIEILLFRQLYDIWKRGGRTDPSPFGSVYIVDSFLGNRQFDFFHCLVTGTVGVNLGDKFLVVFLWDQAEGSRSNIIEIWQKHHVPSVAKALPDDRRETAYLAHHVSNLSSQGFWNPVLSGLKWLTPLPSLIGPLVGKRWTSLKPSGN